MSDVISDFRPICKFEHFNGRAEKLQMLVSRIICRYLLMYIDTYLLTYSSLQWHENLL